MINKKADLDVVRRIGVDMDETLFPTLPHFIEWHNLHFGTKVVLPDFNEYGDWSRIFNIDVETIVERFLIFMKGPYLDLELLPFPGANETLVKLKANGIRPGIITSRQGELAGITAKQITTYFEDYSLFKFISFGNKYARNNGSFCEKWEQCQRFDVRLMVEDNTDDAVKLADHGISTILFNNGNSYPWSDNWEPIDNVFIAQSWCEIYPLATELVQQVY